MVCSVAWPVRRDCMRFYLGAGWLLNATEVTDNIFLCPCMREKTAWVWLHVELPAAGVAARSVATHERPLPLHTRWP